MSAKRPETDVAKLAEQLAAIATGTQPDVRAKLAPLAASVEALGRALQAPEGDAAARARAADELERARDATTQALSTASVASARPQVNALTSTIDLVIEWLRTPTAANTAAVERLVAAIRAAGGEVLWTDQAAEAKRKAELDADVQKSLDEIKAGMPKLKL